MNKRLFLTPAGGALIAICFFLPWIKVSCMGTATYSGVDCGGVYWTLFGAGIAVFGTFFLFRHLKRLDLMPTIVSVSSVVSAAVIIYGVLSIAGGKRVLLFRVGPDDVNLRLQIGAYGTLIGYLLTWAGIAPMIRRRRRPSKSTQTIEGDSLSEPSAESQLKHTST